MVVMDVRDNRRHVLGAKGSAQQSSNVAKVAFGG
jgi:hypothetical protein